VKITVRARLSYRRILATTNAKQKPNFSETNKKAQESTLAPTNLLKLPFFPNNFKNSA
jgi:hypothetical protein